MLLVMIKAFTCRRCGTSFDRKWFPSWPERQFCGKTCELAWRATDEGFKDKLRANMAKANTSSAVREYQNSSRNPFKGPQAEAIRQKSLSIQRASGWPTLTGGNGTGLTIPQEMLLRQLGSEFTPELSVSLGKREPGYPTCCKVDLGCERLKLAIELDGPTHRAHKQQAKDDKKQAKLVSLGWTVMRFLNTEVLSDLSGTCLQVRETMSLLEF